MIRFRDVSRSVQRAPAADPCGSVEWLGTKRGVVGDGKGRSSETRNLKMLIVAAHRPDLLAEVLP